MDMTSMRNVKVTIDDIRSAKRIYVSVIFNQDEDGWVQVTKKAMIETISFGVQNVYGDFDKSRNLWISRDYNN